MQSLSCVWLFATPWTTAYQAPPSIGFSRQEYWSGLPFPSPRGICLTQGMNPGLPHCRQTLYIWATRESHEVLQSADKYRRGQQLRETRTQDQMCTTAFALLQHSEAGCGDLTACKSNPCFFFNSVTLITATAGQDTGSGNYKEATNDGLSGSQGANAQKC